MASSVAGTRRLDSHQHFWRYDAQHYDWISESMPVLKRDFLPADLRPLLAASGFAGSIAVQARQHIDDTHFLLGLAESDPDVVVGVVRMNGR